MATLLPNLQAGNKANRIRTLVPVTPQRALRESQPGPTARTCSERAFPASKDLLSPGASRAFPPPDTFNRDEKAPFPRARCGG